MPQGSTAREWRADGEIDPVARGVRNRTLLSGARAPGRMEAEATSVGKWRVRAGGPTDRLDPALRNEASGQAA